MQKIEKVIARQGIARGTGAGEILQLAVTVTRTAV